MILIGLPVDFDTSDKTNAYSRLVIHSSAAGFRLQTFNNVPLRKKINMKVFFPKGTEYESFRVETEIVWKEGHFWEGWEGYHYALKFVKILNGQYLELKTLLGRLSGLEEAPTQTHNRGAFI
jgi:hypothetical protein